MLASSSSLRLKTCIAILLIASSVLYLFQSTQGVETVRPFSHLQQSPREAFIETALQTTVGDKFDDSGIKALCANKTWTDGLIFQCDSPQGGFSTVENFLLNCVRFAIEAGAAFIIPKIMARSETDLSDLTTNDLKEFSHFFDTNHFKKTLAESCPQMKLYNSMNDLWDVPSAATATILKPQDLTMSLLYQRILAKPAAWREAFDLFLKEHSPRGFSAQAPIIIQIHDVLLEFPLSYDTTLFIRNFAGIIRIREDARRLAASIVYELSTTLTPTFTAETPIPKNAFFGVHLRTEDDAYKAGWPAYAEQAKNYLEQAAIHNLSTIYVASGSAMNVTSLRVAAAFRNRKVVTKETLLHGAELAALKELSWDQQSLVDFEVILKSSRFAGIMQSGFAWKVALRRHLLSKRKDYLKGSQALEDEYSVLYGPGNSLGYFPAAMWP